MISICFAGVTGWTAPPILAAIDAADDPHAEPRGVSRVRGRGRGAVYGHRRRGRWPPRRPTSWSTSPAPAAVRGQRGGPRSRPEHTWSSAPAGLTADDYAEIDRLARDRGRRAVIAAGKLLGHGQPCCAAPPRWPRGTSATGRSSTTPATPRPDVPSGNRARAGRDPWARCAQPGGAVAARRGSRARSRRAAPRSAGPGSTRSGCPASWSAPRWCFGGAGGSG